MVKRIISIHIILTMVLMTISVGDTAAAPGMDTDLGDSAASFIGENARDRSGYRVAGVGDARPGRVDQLAGLSGH